MSVMMADNKDGQSAICHESVSNEVGRIVEQELKQEQEEQDQGSIYERSRSRMIKK